MDMQQLWNQWSASAEQTELPPIGAENQPPHHPYHSPLIHLRRNARINLGFSLVFITVFSALLARFEHPSIRICLSMLVLGYAAGALHTYGQLRRLPPLPDMSGELLPVIRTYYSLMRQWLKWQKRVALFFYPVSAIGGALIGMSVGSHLEMLLQQPRVWWVLGGVAVVLTLLAHWVAGYLSKIAFGHYLEQLRSAIDFLEKQE